MNDEIKELTGVKMLVWDDHEIDAKEKIVYGKVTGVEYPYIAKATSGLLSMGWKHAKPLPKPWEVAPEGKRIVSIEEREEFDYPSKTTVMYCNKQNPSGWYASNNLNGWNDEYKSGYAFAVPLDFTFEPEVKRMTMTEVCALAGCNVEIVEG